MEKICEIQSKFSISFLEMLWNTRYPIVARALGLAAFRPSARASKGILHTRDAVALNLVLIISSSARMMRVGALNPLICPLCKSQYAQ